MEIGPWPRGVENSVTSKIYPDRKAFGYVGLDPAGSVIEWARLLYVVWM